MARLGRGIPHRPRITAAVSTVVVDQSFTPSEASLTLTGYAPTVVVDQSFTPSEASLTLTGYATDAVVGQSFTSDLCRN